MNAQANIALSAAFTYSGQGVDPDLWDRFQTQLAADMRRRTIRERAENRKRTGSSEHRASVNGLTMEERAFRMEARRNAITAFLENGPATTDQIWQAIGHELEVSKEVMGGFLTDMKDSELILASYNKVQGRRCALWSKK